MGIYTIRMIISPKAALLRILEAEWNTSSSICAWVSRWWFFRIAKWCITASTTITDPSTIIPKSIAPKLIRLALTPKRFIIPKAKSKESGMAVATISPARRFPKKSTKMKMTISAPSKRFFSTVWMARCTKSVRSKKGSITISSGRDCCMVGSFSLIRLTTSWLFSPLSIITTPPTASTSPL